jgi:hypothetical protein
VAETAIGSNSQVNDLVKYQSEGQRRRQIRARLWFPLHSAPQAVVLFTQHVFRDNRPMDDPSRGPWAFHTHVHGLFNGLLDRDGRVIGCNLSIGNGPLFEQAPAMAELLRELVACGSAELLRAQASAILREIVVERHASRVRMTSNCACDGSYKRRMSWACGYSGTKTFP